LPSTAAITTASVIFPASVVVSMMYQSGIIAPIIGIAPSTINDCDDVIANLFSYRRINFYLDTPHLSDSADDAGQGVPELLSRWHCTSTSHQSPPYTLSMRSRIAAGLSPRQNL
jgi:hypothetical protein